MSGDDGTLAGPQRRLEDGVEVGGQMVQAVVAAAGRDTAAAVAAVVEGDDPVVRRQVGDLVGPHPDGAGDAVRQHDRIAVLGTEDLGVQAGAVLRADGYGATGPQRPSRGEGAACRVSL